MTIYGYDQDYFVKTFENLSLPVAISFDLYDDYKEDQSFWRSLKDNLNIINNINNIKESCLDKEIEINIITLNKMVKASVWGNDHDGKKHIFVE